MLSHFSRVWLFATPWTVAFQAPLPMEFSRQEDESGLPCPSPGDLPHPGIEPVSLTFPDLVGRFFTTSATWEAHITLTKHLTSFLKPHQNCNKCTRDKEKWNRDIRERDTLGNLGREHLDEGVGTAWGRPAGKGADKNSRKPSVWRNKRIQLGAHIRILSALRAHPGGGYKNLHKWLNGTEPHTHTLHGRVTCRIPCIYNYFRIKG